MNDRSIFFVGAIYLVIVMPMAESYAAGIGFSLGYGQEKWSQEIRYAGDRNLSYQGFIFDTVNEQRIFNYRLNVMDISNQSSKASGLDMKGLAVANNFTFAVIQTPTTRVWLGPQVKVAFYNVLNENNQNIAEDATGFGVGPVAGINIRFKQVLSLSFSASYDFISDYTINYSDFFLESSDLDSSGMHFDATIIFHLGRQVNKSSPI